MICRTNQSAGQTFIIKEQETNDLAVIAQSFHDYFISYPKDVQEKISESIFDLSNLITRNPNTKYRFNATDDEFKETRKQFIVTIRIYILVEVKLMLQTYIKT